jgi:hypothetical protein
VKLFLISRLKDWDEICSNSSTNIWVGALGGWTETSDMTACKSLLFSIFFAVTSDTFLRLNIKSSCTLSERHRGCVDGGRKHTLLHQSNVYSRYFAFSSSRAYLSYSSSCTFPGHERRLCSEIECLMGVERRGGMI